MYFLNILLLLTIILNNYPVLFIFFETEIKLEGNNKIPFKFDVNNLKNKQFNFKI
jgi:hypothetical protein